MTLYTQGQCLKTLKEDEGAYWRDRCTCVTKKDRTDLCNKCSRSACFCEADSMVARVWLCQGREFTGSFPVEFATFYDDTTDCCSMSSDELGCGMNNDVCTVLDRSYKVWCCECVIYNERDLMSVSDLSASFNINNVRVRVSKSLDVKCFGVVLDRILYFFKIEDVYECCCDSICRKGMLQKVCCSTVDVLCCYDVVSVLCKVLNRVCNCCCTGSYCKCCCTAFKCCDSLLKNVLCRVCQTSVDVTCICKSETSCCMIAVTEYIRRCLVNRNCSCIGNRIRLFLSYVKLKCFKFEFSVFLIFCGGRKKLFLPTAYCI